MSASGAASTSQIVTLPNIPELFDPDFLDALLPPRSTPDAIDVDAPEPENTFMNALKSVAHRKYTQNSAPAFNSTLSHTLDAFQTLSLHMPRERINAVLYKAWEEDPGLALRIIWNTRSIHDGKGDKELFYKAFGWLYEHHPRTAIANLSQLVAPVCVVKSRSRSTQMPHGYWKDLLNILALATLEQLDTYPAPFLHVDRGFSARGRSVGPKRLTAGERLAGMTAEQSGELLSARNQKARAFARERRVKNAADSHRLLLSKLSERRFRALYVVVARLFSDELVEQASLMRKAEALADGDERDCILRKVSFVGKWAPTPSASHDRVTNISTAVAILLYRGGVMSSLSRPVDASAALSGDDVHVLRSFYQRWVLTPLRASSRVPEPLMAARRWGDVSYKNVPSKCMHINSKNFFKHDEQRFDAYLESVAEGKVQISGATLLPHELVAKAIAPTVHNSVPTGFRSRVARREAQVADAQWNTMLAKLREAGTLDNSLAVCDVSGSMGAIYWQDRETQPILPAVALSMVLAQLAKPPFANMFITFTAEPEIVTLQDGVGIAANVAAMVRSSWGSNTNLHAVFVRLLLPLAVQHRVPREDMVKRLFVFSDMQFDAAEPAKEDPGAWVTNHDAIARAYEEAGYDVPEIVYWNLAGELQTAPVEAEHKGVALMSGFSPAMMKVFMDEDVEEPLDDDTVLVDETGEEVKLPRKPEMTPLSIMKHALEKPSYDGLMVSD
ncbi:hypothetical protein EDB85DRAFT_1860689 [Lactarius pseudohatsudake]|nr:hypothetical protein EDB85DRAFT_1860689 [Lactarius pseudohatsudake]